MRIIICKQQVSETVPGMVALNKHIPQYQADIKNLLTKIDNENYRLSYLASDLYLILITINTFSDPKLSMLSPYVFKLSR